MTQETLLKIIDLFFQKSFDKRQVAEQTLSPCKVFGKFSIAPEYPDERDPSYFDGLAIKLSKPLMIDMAALQKKLGPPLKLPFVDYSSSEKKPDPTEGSVLVFLPKKPGYTGESYVILTTTSHSLTGTIPIRSLALSLEEDFLGDYAKYAGKYKVEVNQDGKLYETTGTVEFKQDLGVKIKRCDTYFPKQGNACVQFQVNYKGLFLSFDEASNGSSANQNKELIGLVQHRFGVGFCQSPKDCPLENLFEIGYYPDRNEFFVTVYESTKHLRFIDSKNIEFEGKTRKCLSSAGHLGCMMYGPWKFLEKYVFTRE